MIPEKQSFHEQIKAENQAAVYDAAIIGGGPAGLLAALELSAQLDSVLLIGPENAGQETRSTALMMPSIAFLERHGIWQRLEKTAAPLRVMRILDGTKRLIRSPAAEFHAAEIDLFAFGYNVLNRELNAALAEAVAGRANITRCAAQAESYIPRADRVEISLSGGESKAARLVAAADGRNSAARVAAGIAVSRWAYPQTALTVSFAHEFPHDFISTEFHTEEGPFTQVPLPGKRSALVWTMRPEKARALQALSREALSDKIAERMGFMLGKTEAETLPEAWPMGGLTAKIFAAKRIALLGEAAHAFPPIGAQGLNLTIRDAEDLGRAAALCRKDAGAEPVMAAYNKRRRPDVLFRTAIVHSLNRALLANFLPIQLIRSGGLAALRRHSALRSLFMREGMAPGLGLQKLLPPFLQRR